MASRVVLHQGELDELLNGPQGDVAKDLLRRAVRVDRAAKQLAPVDTGRLRSSITHAVDRDAQGLYALIGTNVAYAIYVELGTRYQGAQAFLTPALGAAA